MSYLMRSLTRPKPRSKRSILVVGGAGYIGSHMVRALKQSGFRPVVLDNLSTGRRRFVPSDVPFIKGDLNRKKDLDKVFTKFPISCVIHFAALSIVSESVEAPLPYYANNVSAFVTLLSRMHAHRVRQIIFSSSAAVYGNPFRVPIRESDQLAPINPYGKSKLMIEDMLKDAAAANGIKYMILRYFNAAGAHPSGAIGEAHEPETHLIPNIFKVLKGQRRVLDVYGNRYGTRDGTCLRDYVHVEDLCDAHLLALRALQRHKISHTLNLGSGRGYTVMDVIRRAEGITQKKLRYRIVRKRAGDPAKLVASHQKAFKILKWKPKRSLDEILASGWKWEQNR